MGLCPKTKKAMHISDNVPTAYAGKKGRLMSASDNGRAEEA